MLSFRLKNSCKVGWCIFECENRFEVLPPLSCTLYYNQEFIILDVALPLKLWTLAITQQCVQLLSILLYFSRPKQAHAGIVVFYVANSIEN